MVREGSRLRDRRKTRATCSSIAAFTLLEILLTLALIGLLATALIVGAVKLTEPRALTAEDVFWKAVTESRREALLSNQEVRLRFVTQKKMYALVSNGPAGERQYPFENMDDVKVEFLTAGKPGSAILLHGQLVETQTVPSVTFYGDGTCSPFRVQLRTGGAARVLAIDPWTCAPVLPATENNRST